MAIATDKFITRIERECPGAPTELMRQALIDAASEFCTLSRSWTEIADAQLVVGGVNDYEVDLPSAAVALHIDDIWCGVNKLAEKTMRQIMVLMPTWQTAVGSVPLYYNAEFNIDGLRVYPMPDGINPSDLRIKGVFQPGETAQTLPDYMWNRWRDVLASGAKAKLMLMPGVTWSKPDLVRVHEAIFMNGCMDARIAALHSNVASSLSVANRRFQ